MTNSHNQQSHWTESFWFVAEFVSGPTLPRSHSNLLHSRYEGAGGKKKIKMIEISVHDGMGWFTRWGLLV